MAETSNLTHYERSQKKRLRLASIIIFIGVPSMLFILFNLLGNKMYMLASILMLAMVMAPFFMIFEKRKPRARELVLLVTMSAIIIVAQITFSIVMPLQIGTALVIISGISLGPEAGFLIGALTRLVCNFYMGQGPWTVWQMFCWGILGFLAGIFFSRTGEELGRNGRLGIIMRPIIAIICAWILGYVSYIIFPGQDDTFWGWRVYVFGLIGLVVGVVFQKRKLPQDNLIMAAVTFMITFIVYGGIMNISALVTSSSMPGGTEISLEGMKIIYITGLPYDVFHAASAALCVFAFGNNIVQKLERIKIKYGIYK